jgi:hypothetical protein
LKHIRETLPSSVYVFNTHLSSAKTEHFLYDTDNRLRDIRIFLDRVAEANGSNLELAEVIITRHTDVQHGKFDRGRRKMPWVQWQKGSLVLTMARASDTTRDIQEPEEIMPHPYRLYAADAWIEAARKR